MGDKYACFGMTMPASYISDNTTRTGAEWDLFREAVRYKYENEEYRFTFKGTLDGMWAQARWDTIEDKIIPGGYISFSDPQFQPEGVLIRISAIKDYLTEPYKPELELTNVVIGGGLRSEVRKIDQLEVVTDDRIRDIANLTVRQWRDKEELRRGLARLHLEFSEGISPITVNTMQLVAGSSQCQFRFVSSSTTPTPVNLAIVYDPTGNTLSVPEGIIQHMTLGIDAISGTHAVSEYKFWGMDAFTSSSSDPLENDKPYWLYAHVPKTGADNGTFAVSLDEMTFDDGDYYNLLVGFLNSEYNGTRAWTPMFGYTSITPGMVVAEAIRSSDGDDHIDFTANTMKIGTPRDADGNYAYGFDFNVTRPNRTTFKGDVVIPESLLLAEEANFAGFIFKDGRLISQQGTLNGVEVDGTETPPAWQDPAFIPNIVLGAATGAVEFADAKILGSVRTPFVNQEPNSEIQPDKNGNVVLSFLGHSNYSLLWDESQDGRIITIVSEGTGFAKISTPNGGISPFCFYEYGGKYPFIVLSRQILRLQGLTSSGIFKGWVVLSREDIVTTEAYGRQINALCFGTINPDGSIADYSCFDDYTDGTSKIHRSQITCTKNGTGQYRINFPSAWNIGNFPATGGYVVMATGSYISGGGAVFASVWNKTDTSFDVSTADDATANDAAFDFMMVNLGGWI